jgi:integrase
VSISPYFVEKHLYHKELKEKQKKMFGAAFNDQGLAFCNFEGNFKDQRNLLREFDRFIKKAQVPKITLHDIRHLNATLLMINGENPKVVAERLGHSDVSVTLDLYSHVTSVCKKEQLNGWKICFSRTLGKWLSRLKVTVSCPFALL